MQQSIVSEQIKLKIEKGAVTTTIEKLPHEDVSLVEQIRHTNSFTLSQSTFSRITSKPKKQREDQKINKRI